MSVADRPKFDRCECRHDRALHPANGPCTALLADHTTFCPCTGFALAAVQPVVGSLG